METVRMLLPLAKMPELRPTLDYWGTMLVFACRPQEFTIAQAMLEDRPQEWLGLVGCYCYARRAE